MDMTLGPLSYAHSYNVEIKYNYVPWYDKWFITHICRHDSGQITSHVSVNVKCLKDYHMKVKLKDRNLQNSPKCHMNQSTNYQSLRNIWTWSHNHKITTISRRGAVMMTQTTQTALPVTSSFVGCIQEMTVNGEPVSFDRLPGVFGAVNAKECPVWGRVRLAAPSFKKKNKKILGTTSTADHVQSVTKTENVFVCKNVYWGACFYACVRETVGKKMQIYAAAYRSIQ